MPPNVDMFPMISGANPSNYLLEVAPDHDRRRRERANDSAATADPFPAGNDIAIEGTFGNTDVYTFTLDAPASVRIEMTRQIGAAQSCEAGTLAASIQVLNAGGQECVRHRQQRRHQQLRDRRRHRRGPDRRGDRKPRPPAPTRSWRPAPPARPTASC